MTAVADETAARMCAQALVANARVLANSGRYGEALKMLEQAVDADPGYDRAVLAKAFVLSKLGRGDEGRALADGLIAREPGNAVAHTTRGTCLFETGRRDEAEAAFREGMRLAPNEYLPFYNYACFCALMAREDECREALARALALSPAVNTRAATDPDLAAFRERPWFQELVAFKR
jgi:Flp pilus assembly protein TadD